MISRCNFTVYSIDNYKIIIEITSKKCANVCNKRLRKNKFHFGIKYNCCICL